MFKELAIEAAVHFGARHGKQEAIVQQVMTTTGKSRASVFRALAKGKRSHKKPNK